MTFCRCPHNHVHPVPESTDFRAWRCPSLGCGLMDSREASRLQNELAEDVAQNVGKADLLKLCVECRERERKPGSRYCRVCIKDLEIY